MPSEPLFEMEFGQMSDDEDVIVSLPADTGAVITKVADAVVVKTGGAAASTDDPVADLKGQFAAMTRRVTVAEQTNQQTAQQLQETTQRLQQAEEQVAGSQLDTVLSGIAAAEAEASNAEKDYIAASEAGDFAAQARAQRKMAGAESRIQRLTEAKDDLDDAAKRRPAPGTETRPAAPARRPVADPIERLIVDGNISGKSAAWLRAHPEVAEPKTNARMMAAHNLAIADDIELESAEYFSRIEEGIKPKSAAPPAPKPNGDGRRPSSAAASGGAAGGGLNGGTEVRLTKGEALSATDGSLIWNYDSPDGKYKKGEPLGLAEFARRKHEGMKAGLYDKAAGT